MAQGENTQEPPSNPLLSFFSFITQFFGKPQEVNNNSINEQEKSKGETVKRVDGEEGARNNVIVKFPLKQPEAPPLKLENEEAQQDTNPIVLWQVYALGGFIVLKWAWGKWQEMKAKSKQDASGEENPPPSSEPPQDDSPQNETPAPQDDSPQAEPTEAEPTD